MEESGVNFKVFETEGVRVVTVTPPSFTAPAFMSFVNTRTVFKESEVQDFLKGFSSSTGVEWRELDRAVPASTLRFFMESPEKNPEKMEQLLKDNPNAEMARKAWQNLATDERAKAEANYFLQILENQRQMWVSDKGGYMAVWSADGRSIGVGILPAMP